jgi:hypothetical protein
MKAHYLQRIAGKTIAKVSSLTKEEIAEMYWFCSPEETSIIEFTDGSTIFVMSDPEGNGPGFLSYADA